MPQRFLLVAEGSGGHVIPALQVAQALSARGARITLWYAQRQQMVPLAESLVQEAVDRSITVEPIALVAPGTVVGRVRQFSQLWQRTARCLTTFAPDVVVGFGGWISAPVVLAARLRGIRCMLHEQNVVLGRTNRLLSRCVNRVAVSFKETQATLTHVESVMTGMPIRQRIGECSRAEACRRFSLDPHRATLLILGGSQGARAINRLMVEVAGSVSPHERDAWQVVHLTGHADAASVQAAYAAHRIRAWVSPFLVEMEAAYAQADVVVARAGASTLAELARCGLPAVLIPYPHAGGHQRANAELVELMGGGVVIEEAEATSERTLSAIRRIMTDERLRTMMATQMRTMSIPDATERLRDTLMELAATQAAAPSSAPHMSDTLLAHAAPPQAELVIGESQR